MTTGESFLAASAIRAIMAQRLIRRICKKCAEPYIPTDYEMKVLKLDPNEMAKTTLMKGKGCSDCSRSGFRGRCGIYEIFLIDEEVRGLKNALGG